MAIEAYNSVSTQLKQLYILLQSAIEALNKVNEATITDDNFIGLDIPDLDGNVETYQIPGFKYINTRLNELQTSIDRLAGLESNSAITLNDGEVRTVVTAKIPKSPKTITELVAPTNFNIENNWFFESFLTPSVFVRLEVPGGLESNIKKVKVQRFILDIVGSEDVDYFEENINGRTDINRNTLIQELSNQGINYFLDDNIVDLPIIENRYFGKFSVIRTETDLGNNIKRYKLDKFTYSDRNAQFQNTVGLKLGDQLTLGDYTRFEIVGLDSSVNTIDLKLVEGFGSIPVGVDVLEIFRIDTTQNFINVGFGFNERQIIFVKPIDNLTNLESDFWSPGVGIYTNELEINVNGDTVNFENYYKTQISDFGGLLLGLSKDQPVPAILAETPDAPTLTPDLFQVVVSNQHLRTELVDQVERLNAEKENLSGQIKNLDVSINELKKVLNNKSFTNENERESDLTRLRNLEEQRDVKNSEFTSVVDSILENNRILNSFVPRYRIRGFFPIPTAKTSKITKDQEVIAFEYEYRYLNKDGSAKPNEEFTIGSDRAVFSNWNRIQTKPREKTLNADTNLFEFSSENLDSSEEINTNQVDIPIQPDEIVQLRVRSISEAGYPQNPVCSSFSEVITINFPEELIQETLTEEVLRQSEQDAARLRLEQSLANIGVLEHIGDSFTTNGKFFAHNATNLNSGFVTAEQTPITIFDKLVQLERQLATLNDQVNRVKGALRVLVLDEEGGETIISNNTTEKIFAGYYQNQVDDLLIKKGVIITKTYFLVIENVGNNDLELLSFYPSVSSVDPSTDELEEGTNPVSPVSPNFTLNYSAVDYGDAPILDISLDPVGDGYDYQKRQEYGQFLFNRKIAVDGKTAIYSAGTLITDSSSSGTAPLLPGGTTWIYNVDGTQKVAGVDRYSDLGVDIHEQYYIDNNISPGTAVPVKISNLIKSENVLPEFNSGVSYPIGFRDNDKYLVGPNSCGANLFLQVNDIDEIKITGNEINSKKLVSAGRESALRIPIRFQYRMTDFSGSGTSGQGNIDGDLSGSTKNITYSKKMAIDLLFNNNEKFSFDLTFFSKYKPDGVTILETNKFSETLIRRNFLARDTLSQIGIEF